MKQGDKLKENSKRFWKRSSLIFTMACLFFSGSYAWAGANDVQLEYMTATKAARDAGTLVAEIEKFIESHKGDSLPMTQMLVIEAKLDRDRLLYEALRHYPTALDQVTWMSPRFKFLFDPANSAESEPPRFVVDIDTPVGSAIEAFELSKAAMKYMDKSGKVISKVLMPSSRHRFVGVVFAHKTTDELFHIISEHYRLTTQTRKRAFPCVGWTFHWVLKGAGQMKEPSNDEMKFKIIEDISVRLLFEDRRPVRHVLLFLVPNKVRNSSLYLVYDDKTKNPAGIPPQITPLRWPSQKLLTPPEFISVNRGARIVTDGRPRLQFLPWEPRFSHGE
jgi:hypothetical protein